MSSISVSSLVLGSLTVEVDGTDSTLALSVLATAPAVLSVELGTPGAQGAAATIAVGTTTTLSPGASATVVNAGTTSAATLNFGIPAGQTGATGSQGPAGTAATATAGTTTTGAPGSSASVTNAGTTSAAVFNFTIPRGDVGATGATGATGAAGPGVAVGGSTAQALVKASGTNYDTTWATIVPGDRYLTTSTTSLTINNGNKTLTVGTGLSYTPTQNVTISYNASNHMHGEVLTYNSGTGVMTVDVNHHTGSGTYTAWVVNVGGVTPATSTTWGSITGTLSSQVDLQGSLDAKLATANNLSELTATAPTARTNLGLGTAAVEPATKLVPSGGTTGQVLSKVSATSWDLQWATASGGGSDVQAYKTAGTFTWTKPAGAKSVFVFVVGGGGGGGSGANNVTGGNRFGGGAGSPGGTTQTWMNAADLPATVTVTVGVGGTAGAARPATPAGSGSAASGGGQTTFGPYLRGCGGYGGTGGTLGSGGIGGTGTGVCLFGVTGLIGVSAANGGASGSNASGNQGMLGQGGGGGAGQSAGVVTPVNGGTGGGKLASTGNVSGTGAVVLGGTGGNGTTSTQATPGTDTYAWGYGGTGGGGGFYRTATNGGAGGVGGAPGGGGGGGGCSDVNFPSGAGGNGAPGYCLVITTL